MKKRILSILVICCMVLGLLPTTAFADNDSVKKAIQIGTSGISGYDSTNSSYDYIHFGTWNNSTVKWRVLDTKTNMANAQRGDGFFLLSEVLLGTGEYGGVEFDYTTPYFNDWKGSRGQDWCNDFYSRSLSITEQKAVLATSKSDALYGMYYDASDNILDGDKVFFLSAEEAENAAYGFTDDNARIANYGDSAYVWWLRSPRRMNPDSAGTVNEKGAVIGEWVGQTNAARPAFNLKPDSVLLVSAAVGGKGTADGMFKIPEYSGDEWKLTLLDDTRTFRVTETTAAGKPGGTVTLNFSGPRTGQNEYISAIIEGKNGATHYGRIMKPTAADRQLSFTLPHDLASGNYKLHVFSEQYNGDYQTDYASRFQTVALTVEEAATEQFALTPGGTYYFDLSGENIPGTINDDLPDKSMHYVPFTYAGAVNAYKLTSAMATTEEYAQQYKYDHSLFIADHAVTHTVSWDDLNTKSLIFGKDYVAGGVDYTLRAPSVGSDYTGSDESKRGVPQSNEWDTMLNKNSGYIQNWNGMYSWGQDTASVNASDRALRGCISARFWNFSYASYSYPIVGFRPVLEVPKPDTLGSDGLKVVTLDLGGGKLGNSSEDIQIIVKTGSEFTAPASGGLTRPDGNTGSYFMWLGSNGKLYAPGDNVPADVTKLTAQFALSEQFSLKPGGTYYFDLSAMGIPGTVNTGNEDGAVSLPDTSLHYVPFTYAGTIEAYKLTSAMVTTEEYAQQNKYAHSLFVADYAVTHTISWGGLNDEGLIFGKNYASGGVDYTLRAPSVGSNYTGSGNSERGVPQSNEWDTMLNKDSGYIQNWNEMYSWGQDTVSVDASLRAIRGYTSARYWSSTTATNSYPDVGFRPVLEVLNPDTLGPGGLKVVTLDLGGGKLGGSSEDIQIIVKNGESFTAPASDGLTRPAGDTGSSFMWLGSDGKLYEPGDNVSADVTRLTAQFDEQFTLTTGDTYWFDLSGVGIPGTANSSLPDTSLHYVPFTYAGTVDAYKLTSEMVTTEEYAQKNEYAHSLFVADYAVTHTVGWDNLDGASLIFGKGYAAGSVDYMLRAPSTGSDGTGSGNSRRGTPQSNEWDRILDKDDGYIKNCGEVLSWGQDTASFLSANRARRGNNSARNWSDWNATWSRPVIGFRPVLEVLNPDTLGTDGLKAVTLDLGGGKLGGSSDNIQIIVKNGESFTAPASDGLTRPDGNTGSYFKWRGSDGKLYAPGDNVPADVDKLTAQFDDSGSHTVTVKTDGNGTASASPAKAAAGTEITLTATPDTGYHFKMWQVESPAGLVITNGRFTMPDNNVVIKAIFKDISKEQFRLAPGGTYYFDLYGAGIPGTANDALPDSTMHYVPFTYAGTVDAYKLTSEMATTEEYAQQNEYAHSLFVADYAVTHAVSWDNLNAEKLIFGKDYATGSVEYTIRVPSGGSAATDMFHYSPGTPQSNEWDRILDKNGGYIKNCSKIYSWGQDTLPYTESNRVVRGLDSPRNFAGYNTTLDFSHLVFRPVLEVLNPDTLGTDGLKAVTLDLGGGKLGGSSDNIQIIVKNGESFTAPASDGLTRPDGNTGSYFKWRGSDGKLYAPGDNVPADVDKLTVLFDDSGSHTVTITTDALPDGKVGETYSQTLAADGTAPITWSISGGALPDGLKLDENTGGISGEPTAEGTATFTVKAENSGGSDTKELSITITKDAPAEYTVTVTTEGNGTASASPAKAVAGTEITLTAMPDTGYRFREWQVIDGGVTIKDDKFTMPDKSVEVKAIFEKDAPPAPTEYTVSVTSGGSGTASASHAKAVAGTEITLTATPDTGYRFKEWEVISGGVVITNNKFTMPDGNVEVKAIFEEDMPPMPTDPAKPGISVTGTYTYNGSEHTAAVTGYDSATMDISGNTGTDAGDYTVSVTSRTGRWADGSTEAVTAVWSISKATQEAPNGLAGVAPTTEGGSDGRITGVDTMMEYRMAGDGSYTACGGTEIENLSAGNYFVRYAEDNNHFASPDGEVTVGDGTPLADCAITFNAGGGSGSMESKTVKEGTNYILPACGFTAPTDQEFKAWEIGGTEYKVGDSYTVKGDTEIKALWKDSVIPPTTYTVTISNDGNGSGTASPSAAVVGTEITLTATPNTGYRFKEWEVISGGVAITNNKFTMPDGNVEVKAIFEKDAPPAPTEYTVTVTSGGNGTASVSHAKAVVGTEITLTAMPDTGYRFKEWEIISGGVAITNNKFTMPDGNVEVKAIFEKDAPPAPTEYTVTVTSGGNGTASASHAKAVVSTEITLTVTPDTGYRFKEWEIISGGVAITNNKFTMPDGNVEVKAIFEKDAPPAPTEYTVTVTSGGNGTASASHAKAVVGTEITLTATPNTGYRFKEWEVISGGVVITNNKFTMPDGNVEVRAIFAMISQQTAPDPVNENTGIPSQPENSGTASASHTDSGTNNGAGAAPASPFSATPGTEPAPGIKPGAENTRRTTPKDSILLREWQDKRDTTTITGDQPAADEEAEEGNNPFTDVSKDDWFYDDVMFVYENGLMEGISSTQFGPYETQTRGRMAEILWRMEGSPAPKVKNSFADVEDGARYADAIAWITENDILSGYGKDRFGPGDPITWEQLAVMFYRYAQYKGYDISIKGSQDELKDMDSTMDDAGKAVLWAVSNGLIREEADVLSALQDPVSRAEIAAMLHRFIDKYKLVQGMTPNGQMGFIAPEETSPPQTDRSKVPGWIGISLCAALTGGFVLFMLWLRRRRRVM